MSFESLKTDRLTLRPFRLDDAEALFEWAGDPLNTQYVDWPYHRSIEESRSVISRFNNAAGTGFNRVWALQLESGTLAGSVGLYQDSRHTLRGGWVLAPRHRGKHYASEASLALFVQAFADLPWLQEIHAALHPMNHKALAMAVRLGFRPWGSVYRDFPQLHLKGFEVPLYRLKRP